jgi:hypothetical protein
VLSVLLHLLLLEHAESPRVCLCLLLQCVHARLAAVHRQRQAKKKVSALHSSRSSSRSSSSSSSLRAKKQGVLWVWQHSKSSSSSGGFAGKQDKEMMLPHMVLPAPTRRTSS